MPAQALSPSAPEGVLPLSALAPQALETLLGPFGLVVIWIEDATPIPGSYWGEREAGLQGDTLLVRRDTPVHSALHEAGHWLCMDPARRDELDTDAGGCDNEESAVCYLQALMADRLEGFGRLRLFADMDAWGYSFRLGNTQRWFTEDAQDALAWLQQHELVDADGQLTGNKRENP